MKTDIDICAYMLRKAFKRNLSPLAATLLLLNFFDAKMIDEAAKLNEKIISQKKDVVH
jgi:hypothetical protein